MEAKPPVPPFTKESASQKVRMAEDKLAERRRKNAVAILDAAVDTAAPSNQAISLSTNLAPDTATNLSTNSR